MEYTKGEWKVTKCIRPDTSDYFIHVEDTAIIIADVYGGLVNARLIAAAPKLYEACKALDGFYLLPELRKQIDEAIAKVEKEG